jgi:hypothetical protein
MWTPEQLLHDDVVAALRHGGFSATEIEFLGWLSYTAAALNNSKNPVKAATTLLAKDTIDRNVEKFMEKKKESVAPNVMDAIDEAARKTRKKLRTIADWQKELEAETTPKKKRAVEDGHDGAAE